MDCNTSLTSPHEDVCIIVEEVEGQQYSLTTNDAIKALATMKCRHMTACWTCFVGKSSVVIVESDYNDSIWNEIIQEIRNHYDKLKPHKPKSITGIRSRMSEITDVFIKSETRNLGEVRKVIGTTGRIETPSKWSAYYKPHRRVNIEDDELNVSEFNKFMFELAEHVEHGINFLRVEASEILAFVATDSERACSSDIPPHLPIAYGLKGSSLPMNVMRNIINDIRNDLKKQNTGVLCEVYDGQFHPIIVKSEKGEPLTRLQHVCQRFKEVMRDNEKCELVNKLLMYSEIAEDDIDYITAMRFRNGLEEELDSVHIRMEKVIKDKIVWNKIFIDTIEMNGIQMKQIRTEHRDEIWKRYVKRGGKFQPVTHAIGLNTNELKAMIQGTKMHRRVMADVVTDDVSEISEENESDPDYDPGEESEISDIEYEWDVDDVVEPNVSTLSTTSVGHTCMASILRKLQEIDNKHKWNNESVDTLIKCYLSNRKCISKLFMYEMDIINIEVNDFFGKTLFWKNDSKQVRVNKIFLQLQQLPQMVTFESSDEELVDFFQPETLFKIYHKFVTSKQYPKEYLAASVCQISHLDSVRRWESKSRIPITIDIPFLEDQHIIFNYPEFSAERNQIEMRTFDYTHILNNLRYHICNKGFTGVSTKAFVNVSKVNHDVLPLALVEDKLDRQNCKLSQRFFSEDVEKILRLNGDLSEADFVQKTRNWFRACDERGMCVEDRIKYWNDMYSFMLSKCEICKCPPPTTDVQGIPIKTYEAILHTISTRFSLYSISKFKSYNTRAVSTLAVESFFSDLTRYEFSGLGAPKSVDIPKLISHVVHINATKHNPYRGFEFTTSMRDNYPVYLIESDEENRNNSIFQNNLFDKKSNNGKKKYKNRRWFPLSKPKQVSCGGKGIRQFYKIDETKLTMEQCFGCKVTIDKFEV